MNSYPIGWRRMESRMKNWRSLLYYTENILYSTLYTVKLKICTQHFYYSSSKFSKFIQGMARPFMFAALCWRAHPLKHSLAEFIFVSRVRKKTGEKKSSLARTKTRFLLQFHLRKIFFSCLVHSTAREKRCSIVEWSSSKLWRHKYNNSLGKLISIDPFLCSN